MWDWDGSEKRRKENEELRNKYRTLFGSGIGQDVLMDILRMCHFGATLDPDNPCQIAEHNVGVAILAKCGVLQPDSFLTVVRSMMRPYV